MIRFQERIAVSENVLMYAYPVINYVFSLLLQNLGTTNEVMFQILETTNELMFQSLRTTNELMFQAPGEDDGGELINISF